MAPSKVFANYDMAMPFDKKGFYSVVHWRAHLPPTDALASQWFGSWT